MEKKIIVRNWMCSLTTWFRRFLQKPYKIDVSIALSLAWLLHRFSDLPIKLTVDDQEVSNINQIWPHRTPVNWSLRTEFSANILKTYFSVTGLRLHMVSKRIVAFVARKRYFSIVNSLIWFHYLSGGVLLAMMINFALPWRNVFKVCL